ncbi:hypothetical protein KEM52_000342 [Ascosphaera acerosa]|nr:hypothetical protein KEM52_000342 [Ascosphaera acerosa]
MAGLFHVFYNGFYGFLSFLFLLLTLVSPGDLIYQAYSNSRLGNIFVVAGVYIVTFLLAALIYACRILTNRSILAGIPKAWIPIEKPDLAKVVRRQIVTGLTRSAIIAQQSMPRNCTGEDDGALDPQLCLASRRTADGYFTEKVLPWGTIAHRGWTAPDCADLPSCHFDEVMEELPFLIEAKAVSLAPPDLPVDGRSRAIVPDARIVEILRRPKGMCMRTYLDYLGGLGVVAHDMAHSFVRLYERAKYSATPLSENEFRTLMHVFSALLHAMVPLDEATLAHVRESIGDEDDEGSDDDNNHTQIGYYSNPSRSWLSLTDDMSGRSDVGSVLVSSSKPYHVTSS